MPTGFNQGRYASRAGQPEDALNEETLHRRFLLAKEGLFSWKSLGGVFASLLVVGWIFIVVVLIQEEKWQLVLVSWLLLYAAAHFCYWYFRRHNILPFNSQHCRRRRGARTSVRPITKPTDLPPSYEEVIKSEHPPPAYCSVAVDGAKNVAPKPNKFSIFSFDSFSTVFGKATPLGYQTKANRPASTGSINSTMEAPPYTDRGWSPPPFSISQQLSASSEERDGFPEINLDARNYRSQVSRQPSSRSTRSSLIRRESIAVNDSIAPIMTPIYDNVGGFSDSPGIVPIPNIQVCPSPSHQTGSSNVADVFGNSQ